MDDKAVQVTDLRKTYGDRTVVDGVSFEIARGETFALLGPNGAGKSTTVEILEGYRRRSGGEVRVLGTDPGAGGRAWRARLGVVLQSTGQSQVYTVREQLTQFAAYYPRPREVDQVIDAVGLGPQAGTRIAKLSGGQQRRVDVALGIIGRPELLFLDEPTTGFDPQARREFWQLIRSLQDEGTTIVLTTHYLDEAAELADRLGVITRGTMRAIGPVAGFGGPDAHTPRVRWREDGRLREESTDRPWAFTQALAARLGAEPDELEIRRPTLEEVYLDMVDEAPAASVEAGAR
ncbi:ABC transporter ATP-binding protein [Microbacterium sp. W1N]|uniref:ABC transporter ATP-binding protein n=1 Tax=Microbacterium festucae TaxID=2977531 RepID=UPI0021BE496C|nr:ABC transporter ATP-binding protein [Microbacterium festucae]MCT9820831.1 ABC transporter ATP-binding protein [Microbacterium festucae]